MDTLTRMRAFVAVIDNGGFSSAARRTGRSKALISKYVRELEDELGVLLVNRTTRQIALTAAGTLYHARASSILAELDHLNEEAREASGEARGTVRVSAARTFGDADYGQSLVDFALAHPLIGLDIHLDDAFVDLVEESFDVAIRMTRLADSAMIARRLADLDFVVCASPSVIERHGRPSHPEALASLPVVIDTNLRSPANWSFLDPATQERIVVGLVSSFSANSPLAIRAAVRAGLGFSTLPEFIVRDDIASGRLVTVLEEFVPCEAGIYAVFPHRRHMPARTRIFVDFLASWFRENGGLRSG